MLPDAAITAFDWVDGCSLDRINQCNASYRVGNVLISLADFQGEFDVLFSHHLLEHIYKPHDFIRLAQDSLAPGGVLVAGMPLLLEAGSYQQEISKMLEKNNAPLRFLDLS
ncbi:methyltransferase domain-containing protein [Synechococcus sp. CBW1002]|uniref:class I SAM-dependent methyltransferase n=1 Tax=Synechococcus sp. CBW1002 TaxID=1353134 RepID=UPI0018CDAA06|nr:methyltransferase domain-containing protein [Synechococcus sp. CBW1002]QPN59124.1 methyltransferase domain-containing protein [Synechococcus sp. CBW1002]